MSVALSEQPVAATVPDGAIAENAALPPAGNQRTQTDEVTAQQDQLVAEAADLGADELGRASAAANVVALTIPADNLTRLAALPGVLSIKPVARYETHEDAGGSGSLAQAAEYLQATSVRAAGYDGTGVRIAVVDSGIDFTTATSAVRHRRGLPGVPRQRRREPGADRRVCRTVRTGRTQGEGWL